MCGICGVCFSDPNAVVPRPLLDGMTRVLAHRGPDGDGYLIKGPIGFGHRRLSIIDLAGGDQPIYNEDGRIAVVFNGEIYNYVELMDGLIARGHRFKTRSDTEVIVHLYEEFGRRCTDHLRGMFAFAIWDGRDHSVLLARDRLGIKPLFYRLERDRLLFASELKSIVQDASVPRRLNLGVLGEYLAFGYIPGDRCILDGISKLGPAHTLTWRNGRIDTHRYWDIECVGDRSRNPDACAEELDHLLRESVRLHLRADVPVGVFLSGGVDSSTVVALATLEANKPVTTFSVGFGEKDYSELESARLTAEQYATDHHEIVVRDCDISALSDIVWHLDEPFADPSALPMYFMCREAAKHVKVCLSGDGADEIFAGYPRYAAARRYRYIDWIPPRVRRALFTPVARRMPQAMWGKGLLSRVGASGAQRYLDSVGVFSASECAQLLPDQTFANGEVTRLLDPFFAINRCDIVTTLQHADQKTYLPDDILVKVDRMSMQNSLEVRLPFIDHHVVEFANRCPPELKLRAGVGKTLLRKVMADRIPAKVLHRRKMGFGLPIKHWFRGQLDAVAREHLLDPASRVAGVFERSSIQRVLDGHQLGMRDLSRKIWSLLVFEHWCRRYGL